MPRDGNHGPAGTVPAGIHKRTCPACGQTYRTDHPMQIYCSPPCKRQQQNRRYYQRHGGRERREAGERKEK